MSKNDIDKQPFKVGTHKGQTPEVVADVDPGYIVYAYEQFSEKPCSHALYTACCDEVRERRTAESYPRG